MTQHYIFRVKKNCSIDVALIELSAFLSDIYQIDDRDSTPVQIGGYSERDLVDQEFKHVSLERKNSIEIDWHQQWADFAPHFYEGIAHLDLFGIQLLLRPGAGFGDLSHPTTRLIISSMPSLVTGKIIFDIGSGSGILSCAAVLLGAKRAFGIEIDREAIKHAQENAKLNHLEQQVHFSQKLDLARVPIEDSVILMNMIESEQQTAWDSLRGLHSIKAFILSSGILTADKSHYLERVSKWGWTLEEEKEEGDWSAFIFTQNPLPSTN